MKNLNDYIVVIKNVLNEDTCNKILNEYKSSEEWKDALVAASDVAIKQIRNCQEILMSNPDVINKNYNLRHALDNDVFTAASKCIHQYNKKFKYCNIVQDNGYALLKYEKGGFYTTHTDSSKQHPRAIACSFLLNDDYEGGEFAFFSRELKYKLNKGDALMFPSNFMYPHEVMPVIKGTRYSIITWFI